jgi:hypothetical protein
MALGHIILQLGLCWIKLFMRGQFIYDEPPRFICDCSIESPIVISDIALSLGLQLKFAEVDCHGHSHQLLRHHRLRL